MTPKQIKRKLDALLVKQSNLRDELRDLHSDMEEHLGNADDAIDALETAADAVSRLL